jgi:hypothetical protein
VATYEVEKLAARGARYALALLLQHLRQGDEPFATYGTVARLLEVKLAIPRIFPTHIGAVAGAMMNSILAVDPDAPLINALVTRPSGIPGARFEDYYDAYWRGDGERSWANKTRAQKLAAVEDIRAAVRRYRDWDRVYRTLYGKAPPGTPSPKHYLEKDGKPPETAHRPGVRESAEHRRLKEWAAGHPSALGLPGSMTGKAEQPLLSGDRIDVLFRDGNRLVACEVKSCWSGPDDLQRGLYQCVKYRAVLIAQERPVPASVGAILLTEEALPPELRVRARELGVTLKVHRMKTARRDRSG